jgi:drug/metabolite transporter (DMT)-like permease
MSSRVSPPAVPPEHAHVPLRAHAAGVTEVCESAVGETATGEYRAIEGAKGSKFGLTDIGLIVMALIWGINYSVVKTGITALEPFTFNGIRVALAAIVLAVIAVSVRGTRLPPRRDVIRLAVLGLLGNGMYQLLFILGMSRTRAGIAALVVAAGPAWIAIISRMLGTERLSSRGWAGIGLQLAGVACVVGSAGALEASSSALLGAALIAVGSILWALFSVLLTPYTKTAHPLHLAAITMGSGALFLVAIALPGMRRLDWGAVTTREWGIVAYAGIAALVIAYLLFYRGVRVLGPTRTAMYGNLQPLIALLFAWAMLQERPTVWQGIGAAFIMAGLLLSRTARVRPAPVTTRSYPAIPDRDREARSV